MDTIRFKVIQDQQTKELCLHILRNMDNKDWVVVDHFNGMTSHELKQLADYIYGLFNKKKD